MFYVLCQMVIRMQFCSKWDGLIYFGLFGLIFLLLSFSQFVICSLIISFISPFCRELNLFDYFVFEMNVHNVPHKCSLILLFLLVFCNFFFLFVEPGLEFQFRQFCSGIYMLMLEIFSILSLFIFLLLKSIFSIT